MATLERAIAIAAQAHAGQLDKAGVPYILHPLRVMLQMDTDDERIVAALHDVVEDCDEWTLARLREEGFSDAIVRAIASVTKHKPEKEMSWDEYAGFVRGAAADPIGRRVKRADMLDNCDLSRIARPSDRDIKRVAKYRRALLLLDAAESA
jgi:(p)ppGpp synthase/HD superfamily hydrolase